MEILSHSRQGLEMDEHPKPHPETLDPTPEERPVLLVGVAIQPGAGAGDERGQTVYTHALNLRILKYTP
jgi:hypothetical protein